MQLRFLYINPKIYNIPLSGIKHGNNINSFKNSITSRLLKEQLYY